jgi:hypothetical protein
MANTLSFRSYYEALTPQIPGQAGNITPEHFFALAELQRDRPEKAMLKVQWAIGGGIMNWAAEHIGDLIHRMSERAAFYNGGYEAMKEKVTKAMRVLTNPYGFEKEHLGNLQANAPYKNMTYEQLKAKVDAALEQYAVEHDRLPTYNRAQMLAKTAAVSLGRQQYATTIEALRQLQPHLMSIDQWTKFAHEGLS